MTTDSVAAERLLTPSKITAWLDCAHYLTLQHRVESGAMSKPRSTDLPGGVRCARPRKVPPGLGG